MRNVLKSALVAAVAAVGLGTGAQAVSINSLIVSKLPRPIVLLEDNDRTYIVKDVAEGPNMVLGTLSVGDIMRGMIQIQAVGGTTIGAGTAYNELTAVYDIVVTGKNWNAGLGQWDLSFGPDRALGTYAGDSAAVTAAAGAGNANNLLAVFFEGPPQNVTLDTAVPGSEEALISTATDGSLWAALQLTTTGYWLTSTAGDNLAVAESAPFESLGPGFAGGNFDLKPIAGSFMAIYKPGSPVMGSFELYGRETTSFYDGVVNSPAFTNFDFSSDADVSIQAIPTPASVYGGLMLLGGLEIRSIRRRRMA